MSEDLKPRKLTEANVRNLPPSNGRGYVVRDTELKGLHRHRQQEVVHLGGAA